MNATTSQEQEQKPKSKQSAGIKNDDERSDRELEILADDASCYPIEEFYDDEA